MRLSILNVHISVCIFYSLEVVDRGSDTQLQVSKNIYIYNVTLSGVGEFNVVL